MARIVAGPKPGEARAFIPEAFDNRTSEDPITVTIQDPTEGEKRRLTLMQTEVGFENGQMVRDADGSPQFNITLQAMSAFQVEAIKSHVKSVKNYMVRGVDILDAATLVEHGETELLAEVALEIQTGYSLSVEEKKESKDYSVSKQAATDRSNGTAKVASNPDSLGNATATDAQARLSFTSPN
ncbi:hypothetical protein CMI37_06210 [Candidatus Pacearchaeota archaeon]|nr:hypothetical protein [Candidatus Pacearchaeota archaeon]|tara:strand:- start:602 stop:1150 length:549 start_codon:yes stop_codon:yes gene_type:complete